MTDSRITRRDLLKLGALTGGVAAGAALAATGTRTSRALATEPKDLAHRVAEHHDTDPHVPAAASTTDKIASRSGDVAPSISEPRWLRTWHHPIYTLDDFERRSDVRFPRRAIMLTIDDGPDPEWTPKYLRLLAKHHVSATFNMIGEQVREQPKLVRAVASEGHHLGNHTYTHPLNLPYLSAHKIKTEIENTTDAIVRASGFRPRQFRAPGGVWGPDVFAEASRQGMAPLGWDIDPRDWALPGVSEIRRAMLAARPHDIVLCHDGGGDRHETYEALKTVVPAILARGWTFVTLPAPPKI